MVTLIFNKSESKEFLYLVLLFVLLIWHFVVITYRKVYLT